MFKILKQSKISKARIGKLETPYGKITTPCFMPVATKGTVKNLTCQEIENIGGEIILANAYHLFLRPGTKVIKKAGGLHNFMNWQKPILTDSGGYQVFSLKNLCKVTKKGVLFQPETGGKKIFLTPSFSLQIQQDLGSDIWMVLDHCISANCDKKTAEDALNRTLVWAKESKQFFEKKFKHKKSRPLLFGILQGGVFKTLRQKSIEEIKKLDFDGIAIGGLFVGESLKKTFEILNFLAPLLPKEKPHYLMGGGYPEQILKSVKLGIDMFDCVIPTRHARHGELFVFKESFYKKEKFCTSFYKILEIKKQKYKTIFSPPDKNCSCFTCQNFSLAQLHHLFKIGEPLYTRLATLHNLKFYFDLFKKIRYGIKKDKI